jgi:transcriptional regulator with XRE-family HTH domain
MYFVEIHGKITIKITREGENMKQAEVLNTDMRATLLRYRITRKQLAQVIGVSENSVNTWLSMPMRQDRRERIEQAIAFILGEDSKDEDGQP